MSDRFEDERGVIQDLIGRVDSVTLITTKKGAIRGNHLHHETEQWTFVTIGRLLVAHGDKRSEITPGYRVYHPAGEPHAWKALEDSACLVLTRGPRSGQDYESDTYRLEEPLL
jgi:quercetin dioxygenase-like cupin family protein